jgi:solute:Na+ symporter, SSS family
LCGLALGYTTPNINNIWDWIIMGLGAGVALPMILRLYWHRFNAGGVVIGTTVGLTTAILQHMYYPELGPWQKFTIVSGISLAGTLIATYLTPPTSRKVLEHFYRTTRPFGFWGPFRHLLSPDEQARVHREHLCDVLCVPFALTWQVTLFLMPMQLILRDFRSFAVTFPIFAGCLLFLYRFWYRRLPPAEARVVPEPALEQG